MCPTRTAACRPVGWDTAPNALFAWPLVSVGFVQPSLARFSVSEEFMSASAMMHPGGEQMYADELRYQKASAVAQRESQPSEEFNEMSDAITSMHRDPTPGRAGSRDWPRGLADQTAGFDEDRL
jgi:hypothetical protein